MGALDVDESTGLSTEDAIIRRHIYGQNSFAQGKTKSLFLLGLEELVGDPLAQVLLLVAMVSSFFASMDGNLHAFAEPGIVISIVLLNVMVSIWQSYSADKCLAELNKLQSDNCLVLRSGSWEELPSVELVPGDVISLRVGDKVPADARILRIKSTAFVTDESSLTGESEGVSKTADPLCLEVDTSLSAQSNMIFSGTTVSRGSCEAVVLRTGNMSEMGKIKEDIVTAQSGRGSAKTPLQESLTQFTSTLSKVVGAICLSMWVFSIPKFGAMGSWTKGALYHAKRATALGVAAVPEGLPTAVTLCLSLGTRRMAKRNAIMRKLSSLETLGSTSVICTDKTGTLTTNQMTVKSLLTEGGSSVREREVEGSSYFPRGDIEDYSENMSRLRVFQMVASICALCNDANVKCVNSTYVITGEPTEAALRVVVEKLVPWGSDLSAAGESVTPTGDLLKNAYSRLAELEFTRERKSMSVLCRKNIPENDDSFDRKNMLLAKGAAEMLLQRCSRVLTEDGKVIPLQGAVRTRWEEKVRELSSRPMRCLALAYKESRDLDRKLSKMQTVNEAEQLPILQDVSAYEGIESNMILAGVCGIVDPPRSDAAEAIRKCARAGVRVMMITGDSKDTAIAIAKEVGIIDTANSNSDADMVAFTGKEFFEYSEQQQMEILKTGNKVFCRVEPLDKRRLISMLSKLDEVVAMTGDGVNDASALAAADIGIAMGITGTEVAKGAADMILLDDSFPTIVAAIEEGRSIFSNMQTLIAYLVSCNIGEIVTIFISSLLNIPEPLTALHLLWINLVTDGPPAATLGLNPADGDLMSLPPRPRRKSFLSKGKMIRYSITSLYVGLATVGSFVWWFLDKGVSFHQLRHWEECSSWKNFAHSALAPHWPDQPCDIFTSLRVRAQTFALSTLMLMEMLKALEAVSARKSILTHPPWKNPWLVLGVLVPLSLHLLVMYSPALSLAVGIHPLSWTEWKVSHIYEICTMKYRLVTNGCIDYYVRWF